MQYINYRENRQRGTADFPIEFHHVEQAHPQYTMPYHWHVEFEIIRILKGEFCLALEEQTVTAGEGSAVLIPAGFLHAGTPDDCIYECIVFDINMLLKENDASRKYIRQIINHELELHTYFDSSYKDIHQIVWALFDAMGRKKNGYQMLVQGTLYQLFGTIISETYYASPITLEQLSRTVGMSRKYFCRFFQEMTHRTPIDYLNYYRIERACYQLVTTDLSITQIAFNSGFNDLSYFIKTFKKYKGTTPKKYLH